MFIRDQYLVLITAMMTDNPASHKCSETNKHSKHFVKKAGGQQMVGRETLHNWSRNHSILHFKYANPG